MLARAAGVVVVVVIACVRVGVCTARRAAAAAAAGHERRSVSGGRDVVVRHKCTAVGSQLQLDGVEAAVSQTRAQRASKVRVEWKC